MIHPINRNTLLKGARIGAGVRFRARRMFFWHLGFILGLLGIRS